MERNSSRINGLRVPAGVWDSRGTVELVNSRSGIVNSPRETVPVTRHCSLFIIYGFPVTYGEPQLLADERFNLCLDDFAVDDVCFSDQGVA